MHVDLRYCKYARDISQARWTIGGGLEDESPDLRDKVSEEGVDESGDSRKNGNVAGVGSGHIYTAPLGLTKRRKGKSSVEEIVCEAVTHCLQCKACRMHPCGREDIDVRMLGKHHVELYGYSKYTETLLDIKLEYVYLSHCCHVILCK